MKQLIFLLIVVSRLCPAEAQSLKPVTQTTGTMTIAVDPRMELLCAIQSVAGYPFINRQTDYNKELMQFFGRDSSSAAAVLTSSLAKKYSFAHDAPIDLILRLSDVPGLKQKFPFTPRMIERAGNEQNLREYCFAMKQFADDSHFSDFWNLQIPLYEKMVKYTVDDLAGYDPVKIINSYYYESKKSYTVILSPSLIGGYGMRVTDRQGKMDIYGCLNTDKTKDGIPYYSKDGLSNFLYHEFSHSFVNPLTDKYPEIVNSTSALFGPIREEMSGYSYGNWIICINEHIVRAVHIRILYSIGEGQIAEHLLDMEKSRRFVYIEPLLNKLKKFERERDSSNMTFTRFYPELMAVFDSLSRADNRELIDPLFKGPIQNVLNKQKAAIIYPTGGSDTTGLKSVFEYTSSIQKMKGKATVLYPDTAALKADLSDMWIMAYGTIESNLFLKKYSGLFPFRITNDTIFTDRMFTGRNLRLITCLPNPQNNHRGMLINTAIRNHSLRGVMIPLKADFLVFEKVENLLQYGDYQKEENQWKF